MGCTASRLDNEDVVRRCKERRRLMKEAVLSRHLLASAHSDYLRSLRLTGSALTRFASGEPLTVSDQTPPILLPDPNSPLPTSIAASTLPPSTPKLPPTPLPPSTPQLPPTPPLPHPPPPSHRGFSPSPSPAIASSKLPRMLSESRPGSARFYNYNPPPKKYPRTNSTCATTPSQNSSAWDWENFYPPSPPDSEYFDRLKAKREAQLDHHLPTELEEADSEEDNATAVEEEMNTREEVHHREWRGEHYPSTSTSSTKSDGGGDDDNEEEDHFSRSDGIPARSDYGGFSSADTRSRAPPSEFGSASVAAGERSGRRDRSEAGSSSSSTNRGWTYGRDDASSSVGGGGPELRIVVRHRTLVEIVAAIEEYFLKAATAGDYVSDLLETGRAQFDRSFQQLKKTVYHSSGVLSALSSSWTSKPPLAIRYKLDARALEGTGGEKSHASTLERLLAWEKKLYEEVKAREGVKIEHEKKLSSLQNQECKGHDDAKLDKTKASIKKLQSLILVTSQAVSTTSSAITRVRDDELAPQLVDICYGLLNMWRAMNQFHEVQNHIVQQVRGLVNRPLVYRPSAGDSTSDLHRLVTKDLESAVSAWHSSFNRLIKHQREYIHALYLWLKLSLFNLSSENPKKDHATPVALELSAFCDEWKQALDRLPDTVASEAIKSFINVVHVISTKQIEELKIKKRSESYSKELDKKSTALRSIEKKFYQSYSMVGIGLPDDRHDNRGQVFDTRDPLAEKKSEIAACRRKVEDEMMRHAKAVEVTRSMTLNNIQTGLPGVFQAMTGFSGLFAEALQGVCRRAGLAK